MIPRRKTRTVAIGGVKIGSGHQVAIQSMTKTDTVMREETVRQINSLDEAGCDIVRLAVKSTEAAEALKDIKKEVKVPLVADIHFDHRLALMAIDNGIDKVRVNPGNIYKEEEIKEIAAAAAANNVPVRIGVNSGSLPGRFPGVSQALAMAKLALEYAGVFERNGLHDLVVSLKASDVVTTVDAYREISDKCDLPLHLGVTAAGIPEDGIIKSTAGIGALLLSGIGDTIRVSLTGDPAFEVDTAKRILSALDLRNFGPDIIACPTCGRCQVDLIKIVRELEGRLNKKTGKKITIAVMGCEVNGPGEAAGADIGIAFGKDKGAIFREGRIIKTVDSGKAVDELLELVNNMIKGRQE